jgi:hypothetical protein
MCPNTYEILLAQAKKYVNENVTKVYDEQGDEVIDIRTIQDGEILYVK